MCVMFPVQYLVWLDKLCQNYQCHALRLKFYLILDYFLAQAARFNGYFITSGRWQHSNASGHALSLTKSTSITQLWSHLWSSARWLQTTCDPCKMADQKMLVNCQSLWTSLERRCSKIASTVLPSPRPSSSVCTCLTIRFSTFVLPRLYLATYKNR